jgi:hypothetical protein
MAIGDFLKSDAGKAMAIGMAAAVVAPVAIAALGGIARPLARAAIKSGILLFEKGRETVAEMGEVMEDLVAEARADIEESRAAEAGAAAGAAREPAAGTEQPEE